MSGDWCLIESNPAIFTELISNLGVKGVSVEEIIELDKSQLEKFKRVFGLILLFKWKPKSDGALIGTVQPNAPVFFARQTIQNACATLAVINTLCNYPDEIDLGENMREFLQFTAEFDSEIRGEQVSSFDVLRLVHNSFAPPTVFDDESKRNAPSESDVFHFVSFIYRNNAIWMLDGLQSGPVLCAENISPESYKSALIDVATEFTNKNIAFVSSNPTDSALSATATNCSNNTTINTNTDTTTNTINGKANNNNDNSKKNTSLFFSLMAIVDDPLVVLESQLDELQRQGLPTEECQMEIERLRQLRKRDLREVERVRHNYFPFLIELLKALAEQDALEPIVEDLKAKAKEKAK